MSEHSVYICAADYAAMYERVGSGQPAAKKSRLPLASTYLETDCRRECMYRRKRLPTPGKEKSLGPCRTPLPRKKAGDGMTYNLVLCKPTLMEKRVGLHKSGYMHPPSFGEPPRSCVFHAPAGSGASVPLPLPFAPKRKSTENLPV